MIVAVIAVLAVASQGLLSVQGGPFGGTSVDVSAICEGRPIDNAITMDQVSSWASQLNQNSNVECPEHISNAIKELDIVISETSTNACTGDSVEAIRTFYATHMENSEDDEPIPEALKRFALTYAMRMSQRCKLNMAQYLAGEASRLIKPKDFAVVAQWTRPGSDIDQLVKSIAEPGEVLLPSHLAATLPSKQDMTNTVVDFGADPEMGKLKAICEERFKPVYAALVEPVAMLTRTRFDYSNRAIGGDLSLDEEQTKKLDEWVRIVFICEFMDVVDAYQCAKDDKSLERKQFEPRTRVSMDDVEPLSEVAYERLMSDLQSEETPADRLRERILEKAPGLVAKYMKNKAINGLVGCCSKKDEVANSDVGTSAVARDRQLCGKLPSYGAYTLTPFGWFLILFLSGNLGLLSAHFLLKYTPLHSMLQSLIGRACRCACRCR